MRFVEIHAAKQELKEYIQNLGKMEAGSQVPAGIHTLADILQYARDNTVCPYFAIRRMVSHILSRPTSR